MSVARSTSGGQNTIEQSLNKIIEPLFIRNLFFPHVRLDRVNRKVRVFEPNNQNNSSNSQKQFFKC